MVRVLSLLTSGLALVCATSPLAAQTDLERAAARDAAGDALAAYDAGRYEQAIESLSHAEKLVHAPTHVLLLARAQAKLGRLVAAHESYLKLTREVLAPNAPQPFIEAQAAAREESAAIEARLPSVVVALQGAPASDATVEMDGTKLPPAMVGIRLPVDPGQHVFKASTATAESAEVVVSLPEGGTENVTLTLKASGASAPPATARAAAAPASAGNAAFGPDEARGNGLRTGSYLAFGVGALGVGLGTVFLIESGSTRQAANQMFDACVGASSGGKCSDPTARAAIESKDSDADGQRNLGVVGLTVGGVGVAAGVTLLILGEKGAHAAEHPQALKLTPVLGPRSLGVAGAF